MSSYASITIGGFNILDTQNYYTEWYFRKNERSIKKGRAFELYPNRDPLYTSETQEVTQYLYTMSVGKLRRRLELAGFDKEKLKQEFKAELPIVIKNVADMEDHFPEMVSKYLPVIERSTLDQWISTLKIVYEKKLKTNIFEEPKEYPDVLLTFMLANNLYFSDTTTEHGFEFPCLTLDSFVVALLEFIPDDAECVLDVTDLVEGGWTDAFEDLVEYNKEFTTFYEIFDTSIADTQLLIELSPQNKTLARLLYANVITVMETYLSDTLKKQVLNRESIKKRFVQGHAFFKDKKFPMADIFNKMQGLNEEILSVINMMSFHHVVNTKEIYKTVLDTDFPAHLLSALIAAVDNRHDIVHRNGKTVHGKTIDVTMEDVRVLIGLVSDVVKDIDKQVKDGLLE